MVISNSTKQDWLAWRVVNREGFFGASSASVCAGLNPYKDEVELYMEKIGLKPIKDISENLRVRYGTDAEDPLRKLFELDYRGVFSIRTAPWDIVLDEKYPFIGATLDGYMEYVSDKPWTLTSPTGYVGTLYKGDLGVYEGKTALVRKKEDFYGWMDMCPPWYLAQGCQQLYVTRRKYWFVNSLVELPVYKKVEDGFEQLQFNKQSIVRHVYFIDDPVVRKSIQFVISKVIEMKRRVDLRQMPDKKIS
ncbi:MAG: hypothetical protein EOM67_10105 [Spirochaetia bacterium]|nr:hypothetical protein [Spirochaetia bacterium]